MSKRPNPYGPEVEPDADGAPAIPLWISGRAYLTMPAGGFYDLRPASGQVARRVPLCDGSVLEAAISSAIGVAAGDTTNWPTVLAAWQESLSGYAAHFAGLLDEEGGADAAGEQQVKQALSAFADPLAPAGATAGGITAIVATAEQPFAEPVRLALLALAAGKSVILKPSVRCPSALLAFAELATRAGLPNGRLNVVHGDEAIVAALCARPEIDAIACPPGGPTAAKVAALAAEAGKLG